MFWSSLRISGTEGRPGSLIRVQEMSTRAIGGGPGDGLDITAPLLDIEIEASTPGASPARGDAWLCASATALRHKCCPHFVITLA